MSSRPHDRHSETSKDLEEWVAGDKRGYDFESRNDWAAVLKLFPWTDPQLGSQEKVPERVEKDVRTLVESFRFIKFCRKWMESEKDVVLVFQLYKW